MSLIAICRLCLSSDKRTYIITNTVLQETWERLTNAKYDASDGRPLHACYICYAQLRRSYQLMQRAVKADELFRKYVINNGYEESKKLVSLIVSKTYEIDYNYDFEEQYNLEFIQNDTNEVEEIKEEKEDNNDVYIKMEKDVSSESNHEESDVENANGGIHSDDEDHIPIMRLKKTMQREIQIDLNRAHGIDIKVEKCNIGDVHETANQFEVDGANKTLCCEVEFILPSDNIGNLQRNICPDKASGIVKGSSPQLTIVVAIAARSTVSSNSSEHESEPILGVQVRSEESSGVEFDSVLDCE
ncbi:hypothetical protein K1T71_003020 [Dendrolimus kikuchii]|uniref:Uncharacterized protein n=1 Tax=Dendrolimus kikuchii TaxID=765133 RepID=A0ACC1DAS6_9NEOP|nr:hypothetical protein K1T71_003020 [Dendrolimus kikuchii]